MLTDGQRFAATIVLGAGLLGATYGVHATGDPALANQRYPGLVAVMLAAGGLAAWVNWRRARRRDVVVILAVALAARLLLAFDAPTLSDDAYRFVWDGRVQAAGINPYVHAPADRPLLFLRDYEVFTEINRPFVRTLYPPVNEMVFLAINRTLGEGLGRVKLVWLIFEAGLVGLLVVLLRRTGRSPGRVALYAWHPLSVVEIAGSGHPDPLLLVPTLGALLLWDRGRRATAGLMLAVASLTRFIPILLAPFMVRRGGGRFVFAFLLTVAVLYLPYAGAGSQALGSLGRFGHERFGSGPFRWLVDAGVGTTPTRLLLLGALAAAVAYSTARPPRDLVGACRHTSLLFAAGLLASWQVQPWYLIWLLPFLCVVPNAGLLWACGTVSAFYLTFGPAKVVPGGTIALLVWGPTIALLALDAVRAGLTARAPPSPARPGEARP
jgi:alpha-1,6-mannosyltransferase